MHMEKASLEGISLIFSLVNLRFFFLVSKDFILKQLSSIEELVYSQKAKETKLLQKSKKTKDSDLVCWLLR